MNQVVGLDDENQWMRKLVRVGRHPEWGTVHVIRWFPPTAAGPAMLRVLAATMPAPKLVATDQVTIVSGALDPTPRAA